MADKANTQTFTFEEVAALLGALKHDGVTVGSKHYATMSKIEQVRTQSGYEHLFRKVKKRAEEIAAMMKSGQLAAVQSKAPSYKRNGGGVGGAKLGTKRGKKPEADTEVKDSSEDESPAKKVKAEVQSDWEDGFAGGADVST